MRVGSIGYATEQGLGILLKSFYDNRIVDDVLPVPHPKNQNFSWYGERFVNDMTDVTSFVEQFDVMFFFETPFYKDIIGYCRGRGIKTVLMPMYECTPAFHRIGEPDLILNPSELDQQYYPSGTQCQVPVDVGWKQRYRAEVFVHNAGHGGLKGRNGTAELVEAMQYVKSPIELIVRSQEPIVAQSTDKRIRWVHGSVAYDQLFEEGDVFVFPEKFNGLSLPLQEAFASGMLVMATNRFPMNNWLPNEPLIPTPEFNRTKLVHNEFHEAVVYPIATAAKIDEWYGKNIAPYSQSGGQFNLRNSWHNLAPWYRQKLEELCKSPSTI